MATNQKQANIYNNLQKYRIWKGFTQEKLAEYLKISANMLRRIEKGYYPKYTIRSKVLNYFGVSHNQMFFIGGKEDGM
jgi:transcriptional regulator with XRE-family HTH domain